MFKGVKILIIINIPKIREIPKSIDQFIFRVGMDDSCKFLYDIFIIRGK